MVERIAADLSFLGFGVFALLNSNDMAQQAKENKHLTEREYWAARLVGILVGTVFVTISVIDLVLAALGRPVFFPY